MGDRGAQDRKHGGHGKDLFHESHDLSPGFFERKAAPRTVRFANLEIRVHQEKDRPVLDELKTSNHKDSNDWLFRPNCFRHLPAHTPYVLFPHT
jgi:hypothetical protein